jgi:hypothetical protein
MIKFITHQVSIAFSNLTSLMVPTHGNSIACGLVVVASYSALETAGICTARFGTTLIGMEAEFGLPENSVLA